MQLYFSTLRQLFLFMQLRLPDFSCFFFSEIICSFQQFSYCLFFMQLQVWSFSGLISHEFLGGGYQEITLSGQEIAGLT